MTTILQKTSCTYLFDEKNRDRVAILGLGNILLSDDGFGVHAVRALGKRYRFSPAIDIIDGGTMGLDLLPLFQDRARLLVMDAVDFGNRPAYLGTVHGDGVAAVLNTKLSVHHIGLADLLFTAKLTRENPLDLCLIGIQPHFLGMGLGLSNAVSAKLDESIALAIQKLNEWNIACSATLDA